MANTVGVQVMELLKERGVLHPLLVPSSCQNLALEIDRRFGDRIRVLTDANLVQEHFALLPNALRKFHSVTLVPACGVSVDVAIQDAIDAANELHVAGLENVYLDFNAHRVRVEAGDRPGVILGRWRNRVGGQDGA